MEQKRTAIVAAARRAFLDSGYSQASMDGIAESAGVSVKTIYRHFENKDELFSAVMQAVCHDNGVPSGEQNVASLALRYRWFDNASRQGLTAGGEKEIVQVLFGEEVSPSCAVTLNAPPSPYPPSPHYTESRYQRTKIILNDI